MMYRLPRIEGKAVILGIIIAAVCMPCGKGGSNRERKPMVHKMEGYGLAVGIVSILALDVLDTLEGK